MSKTYISIVHMLQYLNAEKKDVKNELKSNDDSYRASIDCSFINFFKLSAEPDYKTKALNMTNEKISNMLTEYTSTEIRYDVNQKKLYSLVIFYHIINNDNLKIIEIEKIKHIINTIQLDNRSDEVSNDQAVELDISVRTLIELVIKIIFAIFLKKGLTQVEIDKTTYSSNDTYERILNSLKDTNALIEDVSDESEEFKTFFNYKVSKDKPNKIPLKIPKMTMALQNNFYRNCLYFQENDDYEQRAKTKDYFKSYSILTMCYDMTDSLEKIQTNTKNKLLINLLKSDIPVLVSDSNIIYRMYLKALIHDFQIDGNLSINGTQYELSQAIDKLHQFEHLNLIDMSKLSTNLIVGFDNLSDI